jgi:hypothetical protein
MLGESSQNGPVGGGEQHRWDHLVAVRLRGSRLRLVRCEVADSDAGA